MRYLISDMRIYEQLRRTANAKLISILDNDIMHNLAYKYFGVYEEGNLIGYQCPYTGKIYNNSMHLEHIVPVSLGGGTVLFNCIPASRDANSSKKDKYLLTWWVNSKYWDIEAPKRLEKLVNYMLDGYENVFKTLTQEELEDTYMEYIEEDTYNYDEELELRKNNSIIEKQIVNNQFESYQNFLNDCIKQLEKSKIDVTKIKERLNEIQNEKHIFEDIERFSQIQNIVQNLIIEYIGDDNRLYLTHTLNINKKRLMESIESKTEKEIYVELKQRLENIKIICEENNVSIDDYFKNLKDIEEIDILYVKQSEIDEYKKTVFINNIKIGIDTKIKVFTDMLTKEEYVKYTKDSMNRVVPDEKNIFSSINQIPFEGYENIEGLNTKYFWSGNSTKIKEKVKELKEQAKKEEEIEKYEKVEQVIENYEFYSQLERRIEVYIEMLSKEEYTRYELGKPNENNIFGVYNKIPFEGYENIEGLNTSHFWTNNSTKIKEKVKESKAQAQTIEEQLKYEKVEQAISNFEFYLQLEKRIDKFIEMLTKEEYTKYCKDQRGILVSDQNNIFGYNNQIPFEGYENIEGLNTSQFWRSNSEKIKEKVKEAKAQSQTIEEQLKYEKVEQAIEIFEFNSQLEKRIDKFIEMLTKEEYTGYTKNSQNHIVPEQNNIFSSLNKIPFEGYENIEGLNTSHFWGSNSTKIKEKVKELKEQAKTEEEIEKYKKVEQAIETFEFTSQIDNRIEVYIEMLSKEEYTRYELGRPDQNNIFKIDNKISFEGYESIKGLNTSRFWGSNSTKIKEKVKELKEQAKTEEEIEKYKKVEQAIETYEFTSQIDNRIEVYVEMLTKEEYTRYCKDQRGRLVPDQNNIFSQVNQILFEGYENIEGLNTSSFWNRNSEKIKDKVKELKEKSETEERVKYEKVEQAIETYEFYSQLDKKIEVYVEMLAKEEYTGYTKDSRNRIVPDQNNIFGRNEIPFEGYENIEGLNTNQFWSRNSPKIKEKVKELKEQAKTEEEKEKYKKVEQVIDNYEFTSQIDNRIEVYIEMLTKEEYTRYTKDSQNRIVPDQNNIFGYNNQIPFEGYENIEGLNTSHFWGSNSPKIIEKLFYGEYNNNQKYNKAREAVLKYLKVDNIEEYIDKLDKTKKKNKVLIELRNNLIKEKKDLEQENKILLSEVYDNIKEVWVI